MHQFVHNLIISIREGIFAISLIIMLFIGDGRVVACAVRGWDS